MKVSTPAIAIIGMSCWYPGANELRELWENIIARRQQFRRSPNQRLPLSDYYDPNPNLPDKTYGSRMAVIDGFKFDWASKRIPKTVVESADIAHWVALEVAVKALEDAGYTRETVPTELTGVLLGNSLTGEQTRSNNMRLRWPFVQRVLYAAAEAKGFPSHTVAELAEVMEKYYKSVFSPFTEDTLAGNLSNTIAGRICNFFNFHGGGYTVDGACSSSLIAIATAATALSNGDLELAIAGGVDISLDTFELVGFAKTGALTSQDMTIYDKKASGFIPGEGCGFVVMKRLEDARADNDYVYAVLKGWGISSDGKGGITAPSREGQATALRRAYDRADYGILDLAFIEGHGTGTVLGDRTELEGITLAMGSDGEPASRSCGITSFKSLVGHTKAAAGVGGFIKAVMAVNRRVIPPLAGCKEPNQVFEKSADYLYPVLQGEVREQTEVLRAGVSAMGFGGINCHVTLESGDAPATKLKPSLDERALLVSSQDTEIFVLSAASIPALLQRITGLIPKVEGLSVCELVDLAAYLTQELDQQLPVRAALIARSPEELLERLNFLKKLINERQIVEGEAVLEPQQGIWVGNKIQRSRIGFLFPGQGSQKLNMARTLVERYRWARELVQQADEWLQEIGAEEISKYIYRPLDRAINQEQIENWSRTLAQTEVAQPAISLASLLWMRYLLNLGLKPVAVGGHSLGELTAFHTAGAFDEKTLICLAAVRGRAMSVCSQDTEGAMASLFGSHKQAEELILASVYALIANINRPELRLREHFANHVLAQVNFVSLIETLEQKCDLLIEVGPGKVLSGLVSNITGQNRLKCLSVESQPQLDWDLNSTLSTVFVCGSEINWAVLYEGRLIRPFMQASERIFIENPCERPFQASAITQTPAGKNFASLLNNSLLVEQSYASPEVLRSYLAQPSNFLAEVIRADIPIPLNVDPYTALAGVDKTDGIKIFIADLIAQQTGFAKESITKELRLLDDLNLDSIKASEVVAAAAKHFGVAGKIDPLSLANAMIQEIAEAILNVPPDPNGTIINGATPATLAINNKLENSMLAVTAQEAVKGRGNADLLEVAPNLKRRQLVRDYIIQTVPEEYPSIPLGKHFVENWETANVVILFESSNSDTLVELRNQLRRQGARVQTMSFAEARTQIPTDKLDITHFIALLPCVLSQKSSPSTQLLGMIERLYRVATPPPASDASRKHTTVAYIQFGGGHFGTQPPLAEIEQCCAIGFAASLHLERTDLKVRVIDFSPTVNPSTLAERVVRELSTPHIYALVGYDAQLTRYFPQPRVQEPVDYQDRAITWTSDDVILVIGGGKGITAECALALAQSTGVRMALVGRSPHPNGNIDRRGGGNTEVARTLKSFSTEGLTCQYYECDVSNLDALTNLIQQVRQDLGEITGVIHGAALNKPRLIKQASIEAAFDEISPKLLGAINLCQVLENTPLKLFAGFSSVIGFTGMQRNAWYGFSNEVLDLMLRRFKAQHPQTAVVSIAFSVWQEVGMGARMGSVQSLAKMGISAIPKDAGTARFLHLIKKEPGDIRVVVAAPMQTHAAYESSGFDTWYPWLFSPPATSKFLEKILIYQPSVEVLLRAHLCLEKDPYLRDHLYKGSYLFPTVFGLEAMAQAVAYVTNQSILPAVRIEDICLERPIVVDPDKGLDIEIYAEVLEKESRNTAQRVCVVIKTEQTGFAINHFSATFVLGIDNTFSMESVELPETPLDINPQTDFYNWLLFQGPSFQRLQQIYTLNSQKCVFKSRRNLSSTTSTEESVVRSKGSFMLGDPYCRDSLLQAGQLIIPQDICLPTHIDCIEIYQPENDVDSYIGISKTEGRKGQEYNTTVLALAQDGRLLEKLSGYRLRILEQRKENPTVEELANPSQRDESILTRKLTNQAQLLGVSSPEIAIAYLPGLHSLPITARHQLELPLFHRVISQFLENDAELCANIQVKWLENGKPVVDEPLHEKVKVSLSHDERLCLSVAGKELQGCDIETILTHRTLQDWTALLSDSREFLLQQLFSVEGSVAHAGTRIWTALEALRKATGVQNLNLAIDSIKGDSVLFYDSAFGSKLKVLTFPINLTRGSERMVALAVQDINTRY